MIQAIRHALDAAGLMSEIKRTRDLSGGCIHQVREISLEDGNRVIAKLNRAANLNLFEEEAAGLRALHATNTVLTPDVLAVIEHQSTAVLLMTAIDISQTRSDDRMWRKFGEELAALHLATPPVSDFDATKHRYGFFHGNHIGSTLQPNSWHDDWIVFNAVNRLGFQLGTAAENDLLEAREIRAVESVIDRLEEFLPRHPKPALLHGDLWSGNALATSSGRVAVIDPACSIGDGWADIAMMKLFGGFPQSCIEAYAAQINDQALIEQRIAVYQLYHLLNHVNIFGRGYAAQALAVVQRLVG